MHQIQIKHFTRRKSFKKTTLEVRPGLASKQVSPVICTPNNALCTLPTAVEAKQVENLIF